MSSPNGGLLFVFGQCDPDVPIEKFNDWYDLEHAPARLEVPGINSATRYKATDNEEPEWLAIYSLTSPEIAKSPAYLALRDKASQNEKDLIPHLSVLQRRVYSLIKETAKPDLPPGSLPGKYLLVIQWSVAKEMEEELQKWYDEEHIAAIAKVPGWLRARRYKLVDSVDLGGKGPSVEGFDYLVLQEWDRDGFAETPEFVAAGKTPRSVKIKGGSTVRAVRKFLIHRDFVKE